MGMRLRLKASFDISGFSAANQVILTALKKYGMIMADNGSSMYISGAPDDRWNNDDLHNSRRRDRLRFRSGADESRSTPARMSRTGAAPSIASFTASSQSVSAGTPVTLSWNVSGASYLIVSPDVGAVRGTSVIGHAGAIDHLHAVCHQRLRPHHRHRQHHRSLNRKEWVLR